MKYKFRYKHLFVPATIITILLMIFNCKGPRINGGTVVTPDPEETSTSNPSKSLGKINLLVENSASMFGFINGPSQFKDAVLDLAQFGEVISNSNATFDYSLISGKGDNLKEYQLGSDTRELARHLELANFKKPSSNYSDLTQMFEVALSKTRGDTITILVTDGIYDVGATSDPLLYLKTEANNTRTQFIKHLKSNDVGAVVVKLKSGFKGQYYYGAGKGQETLNHERPYFLWAFGANRHLNKFFSENHLKYLNGYQNSLRFTLANNIKSPAQPIGHQAQGFKPNNKSAQTIEVNNQKYIDHYEFLVATDFSTLNIPESYLEDPKNYTAGLQYEVIAVSPYQKNEDAILDGNIKSTGINTTHLLKIRSKHTPPATGDLKITLNRNLPSWIDESSMETDIPLSGNTQQVFGLNQLIEGIEEAYQTESKSKDITSINLKITR